MLGHHLRRWADIAPALGNCVVFAGIPAGKAHTGKAGAHKAKLRVLSSKGPGTEAVHRNIPVVRDSLFPTE